MDPAMIPVVLEVRNHKAACDFLREEAASTGKKQAQITLTTIKRIHDLLCGSTPEAQQARANIERRERTEKELAKERDRSGYRKDMPLHRTYFHEIAQPAKIQPMLEKLVDYTGSAEFREFHPIKQAAVVQHKFMQIFPFTENSGKVGRMLTNLVLLRNGYMPAIIHSIDRQRYYESLRGAEGVFRTLLMDAIENSLDNGVKYFKDIEPPLQGHQLGRACRGSRVHRGRREPGPGAGRGAWRAQPAGLHEERPGLEGPAAHRGGVPRLPRGGAAHGAARGGARQLPGEPRHGGARAAGASPWTASSRSSPAASGSASPSSSSIPADTRTSGAGWR